MTKFVAPQGDNLVKLNRHLKSKKTIKEHNNGDYECYSKEETSLIKEAYENHFAKKKERSAMKKIFEKGQIFSIDNKDRLPGESPLNVILIKKVEAQWLCAPLFSDSDPELGIPEYASNEDYYLGDEFTENIALLNENWILVECADLIEEERLSMYVDAVVPDVFFEIEMAFYTDQAGLENGFISFGEEQEKKELFHKELSGMISGGISPAIEEVAATEGEEKLESTSVFVKIFDFIAGFMAKPAFSTPALSLGMFFVALGFVPMQYISRGSDSGVFKFIPDFMRSPLFLGFAFFLGLILVVLVVVSKIYVWKRKS
jgi:hypothetical protein